MFALIYIDYKHKEQITSRMKFKSRVAVMKETLKLQQIDRQQNSSQTC